MFITEKYILFLFILFAASNLSMSQCVDNGNYWSESWKSCNKTQSPNMLRGIHHWILYEFEQAESIDSTFIWNANAPGQSGYGAKDVIVDYSIDNVNWINFGTVQFPKATEQSNYNGFYALNFQGVFVKKILFTVLTSYSTTSEDCVSIAEVKFNIDKDACYQTIDVCGICGGDGPAIWYLDNDGDGFGDPNNTKVDCNKPAGYVSNFNDNCDNGLLGWAEVGLIFEENGCTGCHNGAASGGLDLRTYETTMQGGNKCGPAILQGTNFVDIITIDNFNACGTAIEFPAMNTRVGGNLSTEEIVDIQSWVNIGFPENCYCLNGAADNDNDGVCNTIDKCPNFDDTIIGQPCNDGDICTENDIWVESCNCVGTLALDSDNDGVCDNLDAAPFNTCTADGTIDGIEPEDWIALPANDCDGDLINVSNGDLNDYDACFDNFGQSLAAKCVCANNVQLAGGTLVTSNLMSNTKAASGLADGNFTSVIAGHSNITLSFPNLSIGEELCFTVGFNNAEGAVNFDVNFDSFSFLNANSSTGYSAQQFCFKTLQSGFQNVIVTNVGRGYVKLDGSSYTYCECSENDPAFNTPDCNCKNSKLTEAPIITYTTNFNNSINANGLPDGILTGSFKNTDTIKWTCPNLTYNSEICLSLGYNNANGKAILQAGNESFVLENCTEDIYYQQQQYCFFVKDTVNQNLQLTTTGEGTLRLDGFYYTHCPACDLSISTFVNHQTIENEANGSVGVNITGGLPPFNVVWNTNETTNTLTNIYPGNYLVKINDAAGCSIYKTLEVEPLYCDGFSISINTTNETSYYAKNGTALCLITGGQAPYGFNWSVNQSDSIATNLGSGLYSLNVLDVNGCSRSANFEIETLACPEYYVQLDTTQLVAGIYKVNNFIQTNGFIISDENVLLKAPNYIQLNNDFEVMPGADLEILIDGCQ